MSDNNLYVIKKLSSSLLSIFAISPMSAVDGPGTRVVVFFQGCSVNCAWCHSPHSRPACSPLLFREKDCSMCRKCAAACAGNVHSFINEKHIVQRENCLQCGKCIEACPNSSAYREGGVLSLPTKMMTPPKLMEQVLLHLSLCDGITLSGGEALLQEQTLHFLKLCKENGVHTCVETSGLLDSGRYERACPFVDLWLFGTRVLTDNNSVFHTEKLMENARLLKNLSKNIIPVIPMVPDVMNREDALSRIILVLETIDAAEIQLNPWNRSYDLYYAFSGIKCAFSRPSDEKIKICETEIRDFFKKKGYKFTERGYK
jgi:pyruvate formate lyase activating enzyme